MIPRGVRSESRSVLVLVFAASLLAGGCASGPEGKVREPDRADNMVRLANIYIEDGHYREAISVLTEVEKKRPRDGEVRYTLGIARLYAGEYAEAEKECREALKLEPRWRNDAHNCLGNIYVRTGEKERALAEFREALKDPDCRRPEQVLLNIGLVLEEMGKTEEALQSLRRAVEKNPEYYPAHYKMARILDELDQRKEAIAEYEVAAPGYASQVDYHLQLGLVYFRDRNYTRAREHLAKVVAATPGSDNARKAQETLELIDSGTPARTSPGGAAGQISP